MSVVYKYGNGSFDEKIKEVDVLAKTLEIPTAGIIQAHYSAYDRIMVNRIRVYLTDFAFSEFLVAKPVKEGDKPLNVLAAFDPMKVKQVLRQPGDSQTVAFAWVSKYCQFLPSAPSYK